jgi:hypothetical protein
MTCPSHPRVVTGIDEPREVPKQWNKLDAGHGRHLLIEDDDRRTHAYGGFGGVVTVVRRRGSASGP